MPPFRLFWQQLGAGLAVATLISGCATRTALQAPAPIIEVPSDSEPDKSEFVPVVRYGRYTLVELAPTVEQHNLLAQVVDVVMAEDARATVGDGLRHVLKRSGYRLCETPLVATELYALPLPAAHLHLGPMTLRDALLTLAGPAWELRANDLTRQVCFERPAAPEQVKPAPVADAVDAAQTFPLSGARP